MDKLNKKIFLFYLIFWVCGRIYFFASTYLEVKIFHSIGLHFDILCLLSYLVYTTEYKYMKKKVFWAYFFLYELCSFIFFIIVQLGADNNQRALNWVIKKKTGSFYINPTLPIIEHLFIPIIIIFIAYKIYERFSYFDICNIDKVNQSDIFIVFRYPKNFIGLLICIFTPLKANSVCLYYKGFLYKYKITHDRLIKEKVCDKKLTNGNYFLKNAGKATNERVTKLESIVGRSYGFRSNCLNTFQSVVGPLRNYLR